MRNLIILIFFFFSSAVFGKATLFGHNISPTSYTLKKGEVSVGTYAAIVGVTDELIIGTSPWMYLDYNMYTGVARYGKALNENQRIGGQLIYFKTDRESFDINDGYQMEAYSGNLTFTQRVNQRLAFHFNYNHMYFLDETLPFSLRREPFNDDPFQSSATILTEIQATPAWGILAEAGVLGMNYKYPQVVLGISTNYKTENFLVQMGFNITSTPEALFRGPRYDANIENQGRLTQSEIEGEGDFSVHPEIQVQYTF